MSRPRERNQNKAWSPAIIFIAGDHVPKPEKSRAQTHSQLAQRSAPHGTGHHCPHQAKIMGLISANALNRPIIFQLATQMETNTDPLRNAVRLGVGETHGNANDFFSDGRLIIVCYACWSQNHGCFERFGNKKFSSHQMRTAALRASESHPPLPRCLPRCAQRP